MQHATHAVNSDAVRLELCAGDQQRWQQLLDTILEQVPEAQCSQLFPYHFLAVVLRRIGGMLATVSVDGQLVGAGFLFPGALPMVTPPDFNRLTLRYHPFAPDLTLTAEDVADAISRQFRLAVTAYEPGAAHRFSPTHQAIDDVVYGRASQAEAQKIRDLQQSVWRSPATSLYPTDIHSVEFPLATSIVARANGEIAGFLFGCYKYGGTPLPAQWVAPHAGALRVESQTMGVHPDQRGKRIAFHLKRLQAADAIRQGIGIVNWTVDPLQYPNAALNVGLLRGICYDFYPDLYPFRNELNRVPASRLAITWLLDTKRVRGALEPDARAQILDLANHPEIARANQGTTIHSLELDDPVIAIEIPRDWTQIQRDSLAQAEAWRTTADRLFSRYVGRQPDQYVLTGVGVDGDLRYLIGERSTPALWKTLLKRSVPLSGAH